MDCAQELCVRRAQWMITHALVAALIFKLKKMAPNGYYSILILYSYCSHTVLILHMSVQGSSAEYCSSCRSEKPFFSFLFLNSYVCSSHCSCTMCTCGDPSHLSSFLPPLPKQLIHLRRHGLREMRSFYQEDPLQGFLLGYFQHLHQERLSCPVPCC